ncbi:MAG: S9 family peptidase [Chloroflexi bacterium]|nr:S9 family peptidase [Chloroflexota bacterium]
MKTSIKNTEKYERNGRPALPRPDLKPPEGWSLELINSVNLIHHHRLSPDGQTLAFCWQRDGETNIYTVPVDGGWPRRVTVGRKPTVYWMDSAPQWSPNGRFLSFTMNGHVHIAPADGSGLAKMLTDFTDAAYTPVWLPDSNRLIVGVTRDECAKLLLTDRDGSWPRPLTTGEDGDDFDARPSPDGRFIAYVHRPLNDLNRLDVRLVEVETGQVRTLTGAPKQKSWFPRWSPDGAWIAFLSQRPNFNEVWLVRPDGSGERPLTQLGHDVGEFSWSPDGQTLAATINRGGALDLALINADTGAITDVRTGHGVHARPCWSPDGAYLTVEYENATTPPDLYRVEVDGGALTQLTFSNPPALACLPQVTPERVSYQSYDGLDIHAFLYKPPQPNGAAILRPHGGPTDQWQFIWDPLAQYLVAKGYTFIAPNFRGSTGYGVAFEHANYDNWGVGDTQDCLYGARYLQTLDWVQPDKIGIFGSSYGGYMVACCLARDPDYLFACGVSKYGDAELYSSWALCERETRLYTEMQMGHPTSNWQVYQAASPILEIEAVQKPILLLHGLLDDIVPPESSEIWAEAMRRAGKTFEYKTYADEPHGFLKHETEMDYQRRLEVFMDWYLAPR